jgi:outer membrane protein OmpA-like peptidoglycan-associated protein
MVVSLLSIALAFQSAQAQDFLGYGASNYSGIHSLHSNPAEIVDNRYKLDIHLFSFAATFDNDFLELDNNGFMGSGWFNETYDGFDDFRDQALIVDFEGAQSGQRSNFYTNLDIMGPGLMISLTPTDAIALSTRARMFVNIDEMGSEAARLALDGFEFPPLWDQDFETDGVGINWHTWNEYALSYGRVIGDWDEHFLKGGVSFKLLQGINSLYIYGDDINYNFASDDILTLTESEMQYGHTENFEINEDAFTDFGFDNIGVGFDLGFTYEWRPDWEEFKEQAVGDEEYVSRFQNKYEVKVGFSVLDIGGIGYTKDPDSYDRDNGSLDVLFWDLTEVQLSDIQDFDDTLNTRFPTVAGSNSSEYTMTLPTSIGMQVDWNIDKGFYTGASVFYSPSAGANNVNKNRHLTRAALNPRWEHAWFGAGVPLSYQTFSGFDAGLYLKAGPLAIGSHNFLTGVLANSLSGSNVWMAFSFPIPYKKTYGPSDRDGDGVYDQNDECIDVPGPVANNGCPYPDLDGDGVLDSADECIDVPGVKENNGCPYGDKDEDGVLDNADECIDLAGPIDNNGCPYGDKDGDGVDDGSDDCIDVPGPRDNNGCPYGDRDNDGVLDSADDCIDVAGPAENNGCPFGDRDQDGVLDKEDDCIDAPGPAENNGCPYLDTDNDGVLDKDDECALSPGPASNNGCPELAEEEKEILRRAFENLEFDSDKDVIRAVSYESLNELGGLLVENPTWILSLEGHTDSDGTADHNMDLSKRRVESVKAYLMERGAQEEQFRLAWFGETQPLVEPEQSAADKQRNRRVEMEIFFQ